MEKKKIQKQEALQKERHPLKPKETITTKVHDTSIPRIYTNAIQFDTYTCKTFSVLAYVEGLPIPSSSNFLTYKF